MPSWRKPHLFPKLGRPCRFGCVCPSTNLETNYEEKSGCKDFQPSLIRRGYHVATVYYSCFGAKPAPTILPTPPTWHEYAREELDEDADRKRRPHGDASGSQHGSEVREPADQACDLRSRGNEIRPVAGQIPPTLRCHGKKHVPADSAAGIPQNEDLRLRRRCEHRRARPAAEPSNLILNTGTDLRGEEQPPHLRSLSQ